MPTFDSPYWNWQLGVCEKHMLPQVPCLSCLVSKDKDLETNYSELELDSLIFED